MNSDLSTEEEDVSIEDKLSEESAESGSYVIRPPFRKRFNASAVKEIIKLLLVDELGQKKYSSLDAMETAKNLSKMIVDKLKEMPYEGYKYSVQVVFAEQKGQGLKMSSLCMWDADTDNCASVFYMTEHLICATTIFAVYFY
ncbi:dynein light chain Tctex-type protein 2B-like [Uloborus diversus]|uniref:dynein light chain Tctex-type protein 2B-like n=1 Tax=Uloborus diversus TaxID=327109 RepID=UPI00240941CD|nr:dynein light chain Tctex-type protein 2B-like [Uloborus diversus]